MRHDAFIAHAQGIICNDDPAHDRQHCRRVRGNCQKLAKQEGGDLDILLPAALLHDAINHPKDDPRSKHASDESAELAINILSSLQEYPQEKILDVAYAIKQCSYSKNLPHDTLESRILQDADFLESVGAISIIRTFTSGAQLKRPFFHPSDPLCLAREPEAFTYSFDLFPQRLLKVGERMLTPTGRELAKQRTDFLYVFMDQITKELEG